MAKKYFFILILFLFSVSAKAQKIEELLNRYGEFLQKEEYEKALQIGDTLISQYKQEYGDTTVDYSLIISYQAACYVKAKQYDKAELLFTESVAKLKKIKGGQSEDYLTILNSLAFLYETTRQYNKEELSLLELLDARKKISGDNTSQYAVLLQHLGELYKRQKKFKNAEPLYIQATEIWKNISGETDDNYVISLTSLASLYYEQKEFDKVETLYLKLVEIQKKISGDSTAKYITRLNNLGLLYKERGQYEKAEPLYIQAKEIRKNVLGETHPDYANSLNSLAGLYYSMGQYEKAEPLFIQAKEIRKNVIGETNPDYAISLNNLAVLYQQMGQYEKAQSLFINAKEIWKKAYGENNPDYAYSLNNLAVLYQQMGQYEMAEPLFINAKEIRKKILGEADPEYAASLNNLAALYQQVGKHEKAEPLFINAKEIRKKNFGENHPDYAASLNNLGSLYQDMGQYEKAEPLYIEAKEVRKNVLGENHPDYATSLNNLAELYRVMNQYEKAEPLYVNAKEILKKTLGEDHPDYATSLNNLAVLYKSVTQYEKAEPLLINAKEIRKKNFGENHPDYAASLNNLAELYRVMSQYDKAELLSINAKEIWKKALGEIHPDYAKSLNNLAFLYDNINQYKKAEPLLTEANKINIKNLLTLFSILSEKEKGNYLTNVVTLNNTNNSFLFNYRNANPGFYKDNFNLQLLLKSLSLADTKNAIEAVRSSKDTSINKMFTQWQNDKIILSKQYSLPIIKRRTDLKDLEATIENLEKELNRKSAGFRSQQNALRISMADVQKKLGEGEVAIEFVRFDLYNKKWTDSTMYAAYILRKNDSIPIFVSLCEEKQLQQLFDRAGKTVTRRVKNFYRVPDEKNKNVANLGNELYQLVWQPLEQYLKGVNKISYSPAGKLYSVAFHALQVDSATLLMDKYQLQQYTSTRQIALRTIVNQTTKPTGINLFGNVSFTMDSLQLIKQKRNNSEKENVSTPIYIPQNQNREIVQWIDLPGTAEEINKIKQLFNENKIHTTSFVQAAASEENLKALNLNSAQILHIATHGFFLPGADKNKKTRGVGLGSTYTLADDPLLRSGLMLAGCNYAWAGKTPIDGVEDGIVTAYEIAQLNLSNTELVVLSACGTALGEIRGSEGVFGLQRAFKMAGVKKMIVSLWQVSDKETAELMTVFYTYWMKGKTIDTAFAQAQADMRKKYSPFYWAAFVLIE